MRTSLSHGLLLSALAITIAGGAAPAHAQQYPTKPITLVIPLPPGGTNDMMARAVADKMSASLVQRLVIENRAAGGSGTVATRAVAKGPADGYTVKVGFNPIPVSRGAMEGGLTRALAGTSMKRPAALPDSPTVPKPGRPAFDAVLGSGLVAPAGTPRAIVERLNEALRAALATEEVRRRLVHEGAEPMPTTPEEHAAVIDREETKWSTLIKSVGLKAE